MNISICFMAGNAIILIRGIDLELTHFLLKRVILYNCGMSESTIDTERPQQARQKYRTIKTGTHYKNVKECRLRQDTEREHASKENKSSGRVRAALPVNLRPAAKSITDPNQRRFTDPAQAVARVCVFPLLSVCSC